MTTFHYMNSYNYKLKLRKSKKTQVETIEFNFEGHWHNLKRIKPTYAINAHITDIK